MPEFSRESNATATIQTSQENQPKDKVNSLIIPPSIATDRNSPGAVSVGSSSGLGEFKDLKGVNVDQLFSQDIRDTDQRFERLENAVLDFRRDFESFKPAILRLVAIEEDIQNLIVMLGQEAQASRNVAGFEGVDIEPIDEMALSEADAAVSAPVPTSGASAPPPPPPMEDKKPPITNGVALNGLRLGDHPGYSRIVLDAEGVVKYSTALDASGKSLKITVPGSMWKGAANKSYGYHPLIASYAAETTSEGAVIMVSFKKPVKLKNDGTLTKKTQPVFRILFDVAAR